MRVEGFFFRAGSSQRQPAWLQVSDLGKVSVVASDGSDQGGSSCRFEELTISPRLGNTPRQIEFPDGSRFETSDNAAVDRLLQHFDTDHGNRWLHLLESRLLLVLPIAVITVLVVWGSITYGVPAGARWLAALLPAEASGYIGQGTLKALDESVFAPSQLPAQRQRELHQLFKQYTAGYPELQPKVLFRQSAAIGANALALPDGHIVFTDAMVQLSRDDRELLAILGHEIGHLAHRHMLRRVIQGSMLTVVIVLVTGDVNAASSIVAAAPTILLELSYSRHFEREADDFAYQFMREHGFDPQHFADIMQRLDQQGGQAEPGKESAWWSTHPATGERIERFTRDL
jgi:Zn-dependent protease with chaperone function